jgi:hypothetical protein
MLDHEIKLKLRWRHTWSDKDDDFVAELPAGCAYSGTVGRIYKHFKPGGEGYYWLWAMNAWGHGILRVAGKLDGYEDTPRMAAKQVEDSWFDAVRGTSLDVSVPVPSGTLTLSLRGGHEQEVRRQEP